MDTTAAAGRDPAPRRPPRVALVLCHQFPGRYAFNVLGGAVEASPLAAQVALRFPRDRQGALEEAMRARAHGLTVVIAWSFYSPSFPGAAADLAWVRERLGAGGALCIAGGVHASAEPEQVARAGFDLVAVGEGERSLLELLRRCVEGEDVRTSPGFARLEAGRLVRGPAPPPVDLDEFPAFAAGHGHFGPIELTRGCIYACRFCQTPFLNKARFRHRSVPRVVEAVTALRRAGKRDVRFVTPTSLSYGADGEAPDLAAVEELLGRAKEAAGPQGRIFFGTFPSELRPEHVSAEALAILRRYVHNDNVILGGQSGSERILEATRRGHGVEDIVRATRLCLEGGFVPNVDFIVGLPGETAEDVRQTVALMAQLGALGARVHGHTFMPLPGTPYRDAPAGQVDPAVRAELDRLASRGKLYGQWKRQQHLAAGIATRRTARR